MFEQFSCRICRRLSQCNASWEQRVICSQNQRLNSHRAGCTLLGACVRGLGARWLLCAEWLLSWSFTVGRTGEPWQRFEVRRLAGVAVHGGCLPAVRLNSNTPYADGAALRWGCSHRTLVRANFRGEARHPPLAELAQPRLNRWARSAGFQSSPPNRSYGCTESPGHFRDSSNYNCRRYLATVPRSIESNAEILRSEESD